MGPLSPPLVSIVTPAYNMAGYLKAAIESVLSQDFSSLELIVMDGGSTDGTLDLLKSYGDRLRFFSGKDKGPADAINKGFREARGEIFAWLNADDLYLPGAIAAAAGFLLDHSDVDVVYGEGQWIDEAGAIIGRYPTRPFEPAALGRDCFICQPASFFRASAYRACGLDPDVDPSFDYDLWIRMAKHGLRFASIPGCLACTRMHSSAKTLRERDGVFRCSMGLLKRHYGYVPLSWVLGYTAYRIDGRDQFFEPMRLSLRKYAAALPAGLRENPSHRLRFLAEWLTTPLRAAFRYRRRASPPVI